MEIREAVAARIKEICAEKNITMYRLGSLSGIPYSTLNSILNGRSKNPGIITIKKLCDAMEVSLSSFFDSDLF